MQEFLIFLCHIVEDRCLKSFSGKNVVSDTVVVNGSGLLMYFDRNHLEVFQYFS